MEWWSVGLKNGNGSDFYFFTFGYPRSKHGLYFPFYQQFINPLIQYSNTPVLQVLLTSSSFDKERMTAVYQQL